MRNSLRSSVLSLVAIACLLNNPFVFAAEPTSPAAGTAESTEGGSNLSVPSPAGISLVDLLVKKGILTSAEADALHVSAGSSGMQELLLLLKQKGIVNDSEAAALKNAAADPQSMHMLYDAMSNPTQSSQTQTRPEGAEQKPSPKEPAGPTVIPAVAPVRVLPIDPPPKEGVIPGIMLGPVRMRPYGFIKATYAQDSSSPNGDDFPRPGFLNADTGPNNNPNSHLKARSTRIGSRFEWPDISPKMTITGQIEGDYEGNFSRSDNRNVSSIRSNAFQLRLAYGRIDYQANDKTDVFFEAGQDWTIFGSSALANVFETTFYAAYFGNLYERSPQMRTGITYKLGGSRNFKWSNEIAIMMPSDGNLPADSVTCTIPALAVATTCTFVNGLGNQLGYGERQGADSAEPEWEGRSLLQFQLDKAPGVVPAQVLWSGFYSNRQATVLASAVPTIYKPDFTRGVDVNSQGYGNQVAVQLPTRWVTVVASGYMGADLRFFFGGQLLSNYNQTAGLLNLKSAPSVDGSSTVFFGTNGAGTAVAAPQKPVRGYGGFINVGFPLSRWFNADPKGRNAGWQAYFNYGIDAANAADFRKAKDIGAVGAGPYKSTLKAVSVYYKLNPYVQFGFEEGKYQSIALPNNLGVCTTKVAGLPSCNWTDWRTEFGPVFTF